MKVEPFSYFFIIFAIMFNRRKHIAFVISTLILICCWACSDKKSNDWVDETFDTEEFTDLFEDVYPTVPRPPESKRPNGEGRIKVHDVGPFDIVFNDSNFLQLEAAMKFGISPISDLGGAYTFDKPVVKVESNDIYKIDNLTHSAPYLVPKAALLLKVIGSNFIDSLRSRGGDCNIIKVTSLLRTQQSVKKLRRVNMNAVDTSTHMYGTTFDISYNFFHNTDTTWKIYQGDLKNLLAEVLRDLQKQGKCYVKYEKKTACFHITVAQ